MDMKDFGAVDYSKAETPPGYKCSKCGATGVKLWRDYQTFLNHQSLLCLSCACQEQEEIRTPTEDGHSLYTDKIYYWCRSADMAPDHWSGYDPAKGIPSGAVEIKSAREKTDQIGWRVPAVPTEDGDTFWGYTSVPQTGCDWWASLPFLLA
jgi:hypothetical protein